MHIIEIALIALFVSAFLGLIVIWPIANRIRRPSRKADLESYWDAFNSSENCADAFDLYKDGIHVVSEYGIPFSEIGCPDQATFHRSAVNALRRAIDASSAEYDLAFQEGRRGDASELSGRIFSLRGDLAALMLIHADQPAREAAANKFVTFG